VRPTLSCPGAGLPVLPGNPALGALREFRERLLGCLTARADALPGLADAVLCSDRPVRSLVQLSLEPEFRRGHGALYAALVAGRVDDERLFSLLAEALPPLVDGPQGRAWIAEHDVIDRRLLDRALSGVPAADAARVRDACARWRRVRVAVDATSCPRPDAWCSPGRGHVRHGACHCRGSSKTTPGWEYQLAAVTGHLRTAWAAVVDVQRITPATRTAQTIAQVEAVLRRLPASRAVPLFVFDAGYSAAAVTDGPAAPPTSWSASRPAASSTRTRPPGPARTAGPPTGGPEVYCLEPEALAAAAGGRGSRGRKKPLPPAPARTRSSSCPIRRSTEPSGPGPGTTSTPRSTATAAGSPAGTSSPCCAAPSSTSPPSGCPTAATRTASSGSGTQAPAPCPSTSSGAPTSRDPASSTPSAP
jgi:DDE superfamily endonuclease